MTRHGSSTLPADPRRAWAKHAPPPPPPAAATAPVEEASDTLHIDAFASSWAELATALADADVPLEVGDTGRLRRLAKLDADLVATLARWIRHPGAPA
ncbi:hypothetical protein [Kitasatospora nipponensis]|uniref:hypothetical protein n=1 Tax=Kitasatospora nipponensis TaxID=258049 RepID=UPI0031DD2CB0